MHEITRFEIFFHSVNRMIKIKPRRTNKEWRFLEENEGRGGPPLFLLALPLIHSNYFTDRRIKRGVRIKLWMVCEFRGVIIVLLYYS